MAQTLRIDGDVATRPRRSYRTALSGLASAQKSGAGVPAYMRWVNRGLGRRAAAAAWVLRLTPNAVTVFSAVLSGCGLVIIAFLPGSWVTACSASVLLLAGFALDSADGQLARLSGTGSTAGEWLDHVVDAARLPLVHLAIAAHLYLANEPLWVVAVAFAFLVLSSVWFFAQTLAEKLSPLPSPGGSAPTWVSFVKLPYDPAFLYLTVAFLAIRTAFVPVYLALFLGTAAVASLSLARKYRALARLAPPQAVSPERGKRGEE